MQGHFGNLLHISISIETMYVCTVHPAGQCNTKSALEFDALGMLEWEKYIHVRTMYAVCVGQIGVI